MARILLIDDEKDSGFFSKATLELQGEHEVLLATEGKTAHVQKPDRIPFDIIMPKMIGFEVLKDLKGNRKTDFIPVFMLTARNEDESLEEAVGLYFENYIIKPVEMRTLRSKIEDVAWFYGMPKGSC